MRAILLSGGMDSIAVAAWLKPELGIFVDYGQRPALGEEHASRAAADALGIKYEIIRANCSATGSGDMAGTPNLSIAPIPEWWPFRNQLILTLAGTLAVKLGIKTLLIGTLKTDLEHADGRAEFINRISELMSLQEGGLTVQAPAIELDAAELVTASKVPKEILAWAHSCHVSNLACGQCRGCHKHYLTWKELGWDAH